LVGAVDSRVSAAWSVRVADVAGDGSGDVVGAITVEEVSISVAGIVFSDAAGAAGWESRPSQARTWLRSAALSGCCVSSPGRGRELAAGADDAGCADRGAGAEAWGEDAVDAKEVAEGEMVGAVVRLAEGRAETGGGATVSVEISEKSETKAARAGSAATGVAVGAGCAGAARPTVERSVSK
jgi:hypothetical protein